MTARVQGPASELNLKYALTRYVQAIQSRNVKWPIKFNGMLFTANKPPLADTRDWGPSNWWQNTRLPYGPMLGMGDVDTYLPLLEYYLNMLPFALGRTSTYFNHTGIFFTETKTIFGAYAPQDYGCSRTPGYPVWLEQNQYIHLDYGGDGGTPEVALAVLDLYLYTNDEELAERYLPIAFAAADFFMQHYKNRTRDASGQEKVVIWPTQALEMWWCTWDTAHNRPSSDCVIDDAPTIAGMQTLFEKLLALPLSLVPAQKRAQWQAFQPLIPDLPTTNTTSGTEMLAPARVLSSGKHNSETPELYAVHPYRQITAARCWPSCGSAFELATAAFRANPLAYSSNSGWNQGIINAALLSLDQISMQMILARANTGPAKGYRFPGFMPHEQDYEPSADHLANMLTAVQALILQPADDGFEDGSMVLFPSWPCDWDVDAKLWGPHATSVHVVYRNRTLVSLTVEPPFRRSAVRFGFCVTNN